MPRKIPVVFENGTFRPLEKVDFKEGATFTVAIVQQPEDEKSVRDQIWKRIDKIRNRVAERFGVHDSTPILREERDAR